MYHIDEHILELYALKADEIAGRVNEIEEHLRECHGCRALVEEMRGYYSDLDEELKQQPTQEVSAEKALVRRQTHLKSYYEPFAPPMRYQPNTPLAKMFYFVRRHPVVTMTSGFAMVAAFGWLLNDSIRSFTAEKKITDKNPESYYLNTATGFLEVRNKENQTLWEMASNDIVGAAKSEIGINIRTTIVTDLDNDGTKEVLTVVPPAGAEIDKRDYLRIYSADQKLLREIPLGRSVQYKSSQYMNRFTSSGIIVDNFGIENKQIIVFSRNDRSPSIISRLNAKGKILGEYWHFGFINGLYAIDVTGEGKKEVIICGFNDVEETKHQECPMIAVLDPMKIVGEIESQCTPGFGFIKSEAEIFYLRIPRTDMDDVLSLTSGMQGMTGTDEQSLKFTSFTPMPDKNTYYFDYIFLHDLHLLSVKSNNLTDQIRQSLIQQGKLGGKIDQAYLDNLKNGIRYWDGKQWRKEWTRVQYDRENVANRR
jgi:hypothetical protein